MGTNRLIYNRTGQVLRFTPWQRATAATWEVHDLMVGGSGANYVVASGAGTLDAVDTTTLGVAGPSEANPLSVLLTSVAGIVASEGPEDTDGGWYELRSPTGEAEVVRVVGIDTGATGVVLQWQLTRSYTTGSTFRGVTFTTGVVGDIDTMVANTNRVDIHEPLRVVWDVDGRRYQEQIRIVRENEVDVDIPSVMAFCRTVYPGIGVMLEHYDRDMLPDKVLAAWRMIASKSRANGIDPLQRLTGDQLSLTIAWRVLFTEAAQGNSPGRGNDFGSSETWLEYVRNEYTALMSDLLTGPGGVETVVVDRSTRAAESVEDNRLRRTIGEL